MKLFLIIIGVLFTGAACVQPSGQQNAEQPGETAIQATSTPLQATPFQQEEKESVQNDQAPATATPTLLPNLNSDSQLEALVKEKLSRTPAQQKMGSRLLFALLKQRQDPQLDTFPELRIVAPDREGKILVDIEATSEAGAKVIVSRLEQSKADIQHVGLRYLAIRARVQLAETEDMAAWPEVKHIRLADEAITNEGGATTGGNMAPPTDNE